MAGGLSDERTSGLVHQASGIVAVQLDCDVIEAFDHLRSYAEMKGQSLEHVALDVIDRIISFDR